MWIAIGVIGAFVFIALIIALIVISMYNGLVAMRNRVKNSFAQIDVQLKRRYDLIPNLVETAKAFLSHERETLEAVIAARNSAYAASKAVAENPTNAGAMKALLVSEATLGGAMNGFFGLAEAYPDLKGNQNMMQLSEELTSTENKIAFARQAFNDGVMHYNTKRESFPSNIIAGMFKFDAAEHFEVTNEEEKEAPKVSF